ncbi:MAG TPA: hypothetical protein VFA47_04550 [Candidatus Manganitrophaceae bacterium]|nr:hypothetical protein [Candidatus Manganitrophaceae bacterium]
MESQASIIWELVFGSIGLGYFVYGKKQKRIVPLVSGLALMAFPYFVPDPVLMVLLGGLLSTLPYFLRI